MTRLSQLFFAILFFIITFEATAQQISTFTAYFDLNKYELTSAESSRLTAFLSDSLTKTDVISISGFTDTTGSINSNLLLAQKRVSFILSQLNLGNAVRQEIIGENYKVTANYQSSKFRKVEIRYNMKQEEKKADLVVKKIQKESALNTEVERFVANDKMKKFSYDLSILFYNSSDEVLPESYPQLGELLDIMNNNPELSIVIHGHVCCTKSYDISLQRAQRVYYYLAGQQVDIKRMSYFGHSNDQPKVFPEITEDDMKLNRRVAIEFLKP